MKRILVSGALGGVALLLWTFVANVFFGFTNRMEMNRIPDERAVYQILKEHIVTPGAYLANPALTPEGRFPDGEPVFGVRYSGFGHDEAGRMVFVEPVVPFVAAILAAWLLSMASRQVRSRYSRKVAFVFVVGLLIAAAGDLTRFGIGGYRLRTALLLGANHVGSWTLAGLVMARSMRA